MGESRIPKGVLAVLVIAALPLVAVFGARTQAQAVDQAAVLTGVAGLLVIVVLATRRMTEALVPRGRMGIATSALLVWLFVAGVASGRGWASFMGEPTNMLGWFTILSAVMLGVFGLTHSSAVRRAFALIAPFIAGGESIAVLVQAGMGQTPRGSLPNSTYFGEAVLLFLPFLLVEDLALKGFSRNARWALVGTVVISLAASGSRVAALVALAWLASSVIAETGMSRQTKSLLLGATAVAVAVAGLTFARSEVLGSVGVSTLGERPQMWGMVARAVAERPVFGFGADGFVAGGAAVSTVELARDSGALILKPGSTDPHNLLAWIAVSGGVVALVLALWFTFEVVVLWWRHTRGSGRAAAIWAAAGVTVVSLTAPLALQVLPLFALALGASLPVSPRRRVRTLSRASWGAAALAVVALVLFTADAACRVPVELHNEEISPSRTEFAQNLADLWSFDPYFSYIASLHWGWAAKTDPAIAVRQPDLRAIEHAVSLDERDPFIAFEHARTLVFYGAPDTQIDAAFTETFSRWEWYPLARAEYAIVQVRRGEDKQARANIAIARLASDRDVERIRAIERVEAELD